MPEHQNSFLPPEIRIASEFLAALALLKLGHSLENTAPELSTLLKWGCVILGSLAIIESLWHDYQLRQGK